MYNVSWAAAAAAAAAVWIGAAATSSGAQVARQALCEARARRGNPCRWRTSSSRSLKPMSPLGLRLALASVAGGWPWPWLPRTCVCPAAARAMLTRLGRGELPGELPGEWLSALIWSRSAKRDAAPRVLLWLPPPLSLSTMSWCPHT